MQHNPHPVTRAEFARRAGRGRSRVTEAAAPGGALALACLPDGAIDAAHPAAQAWAERRGIALSSLLEPSAPLSLEALLADAAAAFAERVAAAVRNGEVEPLAVVVVLDAVGSLLSETKRKLVAAVSPGPNSATADAPAPTPAA